MGANEYQGELTPFDVPPALETAWEDRFVSAHPDIYRNAKAHPGVPGRAFDLSPMSWPCAGVSMGQPGDSRSRIEPGTMRAV